MISAYNPRHFYADHFKTFPVNRWQFIIRAKAQCALEGLRNGSDYALIAVGHFAFVEKVHATCFHVSRLTIF